MADVATAESEAATTRPANPAHSNAPHRGPRTLITGDFARRSSWSQRSRARFTPGSILVRTNLLMTLKLTGTSTRSARASVGTSWMCLWKTSSMSTQATSSLASILRTISVALANARADLAAAEAAFLSSRTDVPITSTTTRSQLKNARSGRADAEASLVATQRKVSAAQARLDTAAAQVREAQSTFKNTADDVARYKLLIAKDEIPQQRYDTAVSISDTARATLDARRAALVEAEQNVRVAQAAIDQAEARAAQADASIESALTAPQQVAVSQARAKTAEALVAQRRGLVEQAQLNLSYCTIVAPVSGIVGKKTVEAGANVSPGQQLMAVVPIDDIWITADFKETQLRLMKPGAQVRFSVDAYGREYSGKVTRHWRCKRLAPQPATA